MLRTANFYCQVQIQSLVRELKIPHATLYSQKNEKENNKDLFKMGSVYE